jgi:hypothetical protein
MVKNRINAELLKTMTEEMIMAKAVGGNING